MDPTKSTFEVLEDIFDFNKTPWAPPGTRATIFNPPEIWIICVGGSTPKYHQYGESFIPEIGISRQTKLDPIHVKLPTEQPLDEAKWIAIKFLKKLHAKNGNNKSPQRYAKALKLLLDILQYDDWLPPRMNMKLVLRVEK